MMKRGLTLISILVIALALRFYGLNWDQGTHLHPDERFLTMVATSTRLPSSLSEYLDPSKSTLNPYNNDYDFYVYGMFPMTIVKAISVYTGHDNYNQITLLGRAVSAIIEVCSLLIIFGLSRLLSRQLKLSENIAYFAAILYAVTIFSIQQGHFFTVDPLANLLGLLSIYCAFLYHEKKKIIFVIFMAAFFGLGLGSKISSLYLLPLLSGIILLTQEKNLAERVKKILVIAIITMPIVILSLRLADIKFFASSNFFDLTINQQFLNNINQLKALSTPEALFPPSIQWLSTVPILTPLKDIIIFGLGPVYFALVIVGLIILVKLMFASKELRRSSYHFLLLLVWIVGFFIYQGVQFGKTMRYFYILYPFFAIFAAIGLSTIFKYKKWLGAIIFVLIVIYTMAFMNIYSEPHSRVRASEFIYEQLENQSTIASEHWDDALPLPMLNTNGKQFKSVELPVFAPDENEKWRLMQDGLSRADYYILSSNRGYGSIMKVPDRFPKMSQFYQELFSGNTDFELIAEFTSYPSLCLLKKCIRFQDQWADEAFTVYDHPRVLIFKKKSL